MKKLISIICAAAVTVGFYGCGAQTGAQTPSEQPSSSPSAAAPELVSGSPEGEITVSCYNSVTYKDFLELAAQSFEEKYPGTKVTVDAPSQMADVKSSEAEGEVMKVIEATVDEQAKNDYISKINTELMGGNGPDILAMDVVPVHKYVANGQLEDLQSYMESDSTFDMGNYKQNIFDALKFNGGQYVFPIDYAFNYYEYDSTLLDEAAQGNFVDGYKGYTLSQLIETGKASFDKNPENKMFGMSNRPDQSINMINELMEENYSHYIDLENKKANFNDGSFANLLKTAKSYEESGYIEEDNSGAIENFGGSTDDRNIYKLKSNMSLVTSYHIRDGLPLAIPLAGTTPSVEDDDKLAGIQMGENGNVKFNYTQAYGINSASKNKALAWEFIKFLAGEEMQANMQMFPTGLLNLPIHKEARMQKLEDGIRLSLFMPEEESLGTEELTEVQAADYKEIVEKTEGFSDMINAYCFRDNTIDTIIRSEVEYFLEGTKTAEEAAASIQSKAEMYFNE